MHKRVEGASGIRVILTILVVLIIVAGLTFGVYGLLKQQKEVGATAFSNSFVEQIESNSIDDAFSKMVTSSDDASTEYYNFLFWASGFSENKVTVKTPPKETNYSGQFIGVFNNSSSFTFKYETSVSNTLLISVTEVDGGWKVVNYAIE